MGLLNRFNSQYQSTDLSQYINQLLFPFILRAFLVYFPISTIFGSLSIHPWPAKWNVINQNQRRKKKMIINMVNVMIKRKATRKKTNNLVTIWLCFMKGQSDCNFFSHQFYSLPEFHVLAYKNYQFMRTNNCKMLNTNANHNLKFSFRLKILWELWVFAKKLAKTYDDRKSMSCDFEIIWKIQQNSISISLNFGSMNYW